jgi:3',5'-cyclic AMP phosphodiesterase CpdA
MAVRRIAQLSDLHLLSRTNSGVSAYDDGRARLVSLGRALDPVGRIATASRALERARLLGAEHVVITGDLTELGMLSELEVLAEVLACSPFDSEQITLIPGNHDRYSGPDTWARALRGPLSPWWSSDAALRRRVVDLGGVRLVPVDMTRPQSVLRSAGFATPDVLTALGGVLDDPGIRRAPVVVLQHHPPFRLAPIRHHIDGLVGCEALEALLLDRDAVQIMHGHLHIRADHGGTEAVPRVLGAAAIVERVDAMRLYDVTCDGLRAVELRDVSAAA